MTCDNASNNDTMVNELKTAVPGFEGDARRVRCFLHTINLTAKSFLKQFDVPAKGKDDVLTSEEKTLHEMAKDLEIEETATRMAFGCGENEEDGDLSDDSDAEILAEGEAEDAESGTDDEGADNEGNDRGASATPVRLVLVKVCFFISSEN